MCICLKYLDCPSKWRVELGVWENLFFSVPEEILYMFFSFLCDIFWNSINLAYVSQRRIGCGLRLLYYLSKRVSLCSRYGFFCYTFTYFIPFGVIELLKLTYSFSMEIVTIPVVLVDQLYFLYVPAHKGLAF